MRNIFVKEFCVPLSLLLCRYDTAHDNITLRGSNNNPRRKHECRDYIEIMSEKKTALSSFRNQDWETVKVETEKINKRLINKYPNKQHHETKQSNLYRNETSL